MGKYLLSEKYRLELHWKSVVYERDGVCKLKGAYFSGPALSMAQKINDNDNIAIDFYKQYLVFVKNVYVAKLSWKKVIYNKDNTVSLKNTILKHNTELNRVPKLNNTDYIVIDTKNHESSIHHLNLLYTAYVINENGMLYKF